jgi:uncharacterized damage-inducible protein DinB
VNKADIGLLFDHLYWVRDRVLQAAEETPAALLDESPPTIRDLRATLVHELDVEWSWRERLRGIPFEHWGPEGELKPTDYTTVESIRQHWQRDETEMRSWLSGLTDDEIAEPWTVEKPDGLPLFHHLLHIYTHALQQFSDAATVLTIAGASPGELDFLEFADPR